MTLPPQIATMDAIVKLRALSKQHGASLGCLYFYEWVRESAAKESVPRLGDGLPVKGAAETLAPNSPVG